MDNSLILQQALDIVRQLSGHSLDILTVARPTNIAYANYLARSLSKLSPLISNLIEFTILDLLNQHNRGNGQWFRQDPGFPDLVFIQDDAIQVGIEIKAWFPLATEITARFRESQTLIGQRRIEVVVIAWLPEYLIYGKPKILAVWNDSAIRLAEIRDRHYYQPPDYLVIEPQDTSRRTSNLQQTNTNGYKFQGTDQELAAARHQVQQWASNESSDYQRHMRDLIATYNYRLDTNFAKIDRIQHPSLEAFKQDVLAAQQFGIPLIDWIKSGLLISPEGIAKILELE